MISSARVAHTFGMDPVDVLDERDRFRSAVRVAAHNAVMKDLAQQAGRK